VSSPLSGQQATDMARELIREVVEADVRPPPALPMAHPSPLFRLAPPVAHSPTDIFLH